MNIDELREMVTRDCVIDPLRLDDEALKTHQLHNKYLIFLQDAKKTLRQMESDFDILYRTKWEYYSGKMDEETLKKLGWEPFELRILKSDLDMYINGDAEIQKVRRRIANQTSLAEYLEATVKDIVQRGWSIRNAIDWKKFVSGVK